MSSKVERRGLCWALGMGSVLLAGAVHAQPVELMGGGSETVRIIRPFRALQLNLQGTLLDYAKQTITPDQSPDGSTQAEAQKSSSTSFGLIGSGFGFGVGYAWDQLLLGARARLTTTTSSIDGGGETTSSSVALLPRVEYMFTGGSVRPFVAGLVGVVHAWSSQEVENGVTTPGTIENSSTRFAIGAALGMHTFLNRAVSLDPEFTVIYSAGSGTAQRSGGTFTPVSLDYSVSGFQLLLTLGLSGWIDTGGRPTPPPARSEATEGAAAAAVAPSTPPPAPTPPSDAPASPPANPSAAPASPAPPAPTGVFPAAPDATPTQ